jgi:hypothetical protein
MNTKNGPFNELYTFNTDGQLVYKEGAFDLLSNLSGTDEYGKPNKTAEE